MSCKITSIPTKHLRILEIIHEAVIISRKMSKEFIECYLVGGYVRDLLMGKEAKDLDCVCSYLDQFRIHLINLLTEKKISFKEVVYETFGTYMIHFLGEDVEFVVPRKESYRDYGSRNPTISIGSFEDDAFRRDFTINTLKISLNPENYLEVIDLTGKGLKDLKKRILNTPLSPDITFNEDPLRMLRCARFVAVKGFVPVERVVVACRKNAGRLGIIVEERIQEEIKRSLIADNYFRVLNKLGLLTILFPELTPLKKINQPSKWHLYNVFEHTMRIVECLPPHLKLAGLYHDTGKIIVNKTGNFHGHEELSYELTVKRFNELKFSKIEISYIAFIVRNHMVTMGLVFDENLTEKAIRRYIHKYRGYIDDLIEFSRCDKIAGGVNVNNGLFRLETFRKRIDEIITKRPVAIKLAVSGNDIMKALNIRSGVKVGKIKKDLLDKVVVNELENKVKVLIDYVISNY